MSGVPSLLPERQQGPLVLEQPTLAVEAAAVARQLPARSHHTVAGDDYRDRVLAVGRPNGARGAHIAQAASQVAVAHGRAVGDGAEGVPHAPLERRARGVEWQIEGRSSPGEVLVQLLPSPLQHRARPLLTPWPPLHDVGLTPWPPLHDV